MTADINPKVSIIIATLNSADHIRECLRRLSGIYPKIRVHYYPVKNLFFGERITVSGLLTGQDIISTLKGKELGEILLLPENLLRADTDVLLDDLRLKDISVALQVPVGIISCNGEDFIRKIIMSSGSFTKKDSRE